jgi:hypothetical protein
MIRWNPCPAGIVMSESEPHPDPFSFMDYKEKLAALRQQFGDNAPEVTNYLKASGEAQLVSYKDKANPLHELDNATRMDALRTYKNYIFSLSPFEQDYTGHSKAISGWLLRADFTKDFTDPIMKQSVVLMALEHVYRIDEDEWYQLPWEEHIARADLVARAAEKIMVKTGLCPEQSDKMKGINYHYGHAKHIVNQAPYLSGEGSMDSRDGSINLSKKLYSQRYFYKVLNHEMAHRRFFPALREIPVDDYNRHLYDLGETLWSAFAANIKHIKTPDNENAGEWLYTSKPGERLAVDADTLMPGDNDFKKRRVDPKTLKKMKEALQDDPDFAPIVEAIDTHSQETIALNKRPLYIKKQYRL